MTTLSRKHSTYAMTLSIYDVNVLDNISTFIRQKWQKTISR